MPKYSRNFAVTTIAAIALIGGTNQSWSGDDTDTLEQPTVDYSQDEPATDAATITTAVECNYAYTGVTGTELGSPPWDTKVKAVVKGRKVAPLLDDETKKRDLMKDLGGGDTGNASGRAKKILDGDGTISFEGIGMGSYATFGLPVSDNNAPMTNAVTEGKITAFWYNKRQIDNNKKSCMTVQMRTTFNIGASQKDYRYELHIFFDAKVKQRDDTNDKDVFPGTALDITISASQAGNRQYKLHDEGMTVEVRKARRSKNGGTSWQKFKRKIEDAILRTHDDNCVDMMFVSSPPEVLGTLAPPLYCLGRCENPPVVNTGL